MPFFRVPIALLSRFIVALLLTSVAAQAPADPVQESQAAAGDEPLLAEVASFPKQVRPLLQRYCFRCHDAETMESGVRLDQLDGSLPDRQLFLWKDVFEQISDNVMPPEAEPQPTADERALLSSWITQGMNAARARDRQQNGSIRRLTVAQYRNTMRDLLWLRENLSEILPPDGVSKDGFTNNGNTMVLSPLQMEYYFQIAEQSLDLCIVDENVRPVIQTFRMDLGEGINREPCPDTLILGADNLLLNNQDFVVTELTPSKPFEYQPFEMRKSWDFIEGYQGNDTVRGWRKFDSIYHSVFACMRGSRGYPLGEPYQVVPDGLLLRPAIPSSELFGKSSTYGPMANFKISLRELSDHGDFRVTVKASRYDDGMLLGASVPILNAAESPDVKVVDLSESSGGTVTIAEPGIYQIDLQFQVGDSGDTLGLNLGDLRFAKPVAGGKSSEAMMLVRLEAGELSVTAPGDDPATRIHRMVVGRVKDESKLGRSFLAFEKRSPQLGVHLGLRRDCGSTLNPVGSPQPVASATPTDFVFQGAIHDFPSPSVEKDNVNYLAGIREIGVRSEFTDGRAMPRLRIHSVEFEGPSYETWPPETHRRIFIESECPKDSPEYAREVIRSFMTRAWRRPVINEEVSLIFDVWKKSFEDTGDFRESIKDALVVVLTSPQFLFVIDQSHRPEPEDLDDWELASRLSYFLWNTSPDEELLLSAVEDRLHSDLDSQVDRMIRDPRFDQFLQEFTSQWLSLDKFDVVEVDQVSYPHLTRDMKTQLRSEPVQFLRYVIDRNLPLRNMIQSEFIVANDAVATYYDLASENEVGFQFVAIGHTNRHLGGILSQAAILAGLSDGRESNPVKRGAWLARKIIAEPPDDPPPNVPELQNDTSHLTLRERLERHRNQEGCVKCHSDIDPWGIPFESLDASGRLKLQEADSSSTLPDGTEVADLNGLKSYLAKDRIDQVAFSFLKHLSCYAIGRSLTFNETESLKEDVRLMKSDDYRMQEMLRLVIHSDLFLKK